MGKESRLHHFKNQFDCDLSADITKISAITMRFEKCISTHSHDFRYKTYQPGKPVYGNLTFEGICHPKSFKDIQAWVKQCYNGDEDVKRKQITINLRTHQQEKAFRTFNLVDCFPQAFNYVNIEAEGNSGGVMHWTLEVRALRIEMK